MGGVIVGDKVYLGVTLTSASPLVTGVSFPCLMKRLGVGLRTVEFLSEHLSLGR